MFVLCAALPAEAAAVWFPWSKSRPSPEDSAAAAIAAQTDSLLPVLVEHRKTSFDLYALRNEKLVKQLWFAAGPRGPFEAGEYQVLATYPDSGGRKAYLLREGTQLAELPDSVTERFWTRIRSEGGLGSGQSLQQTLASGFWRNIWNPADPLQPYRWPTGVSGKAELAITAIPSSDVSYMREYSGAVAVRPVPWIITEAGWHNTRHGGGLRDNLQHAPDDSTWTDWGPDENWWRFAIGIPGIKYEVSLADRAFPEFYWLDPKAGDATYKTGQPGSPLVDSLEDGNVIRRWRTGGQKGGIAGNLTHALHAKAGVIHYSAWFDEDLYRSIIQQVMFEDLPVPFGQWGFGLTFADRAAHTRIYVDFFPASFGLPPRRLGNSMKLFFLRLDVDLRSSDTFRVGASSRLLLDGPILRPGDKR